MPNAPGVDSILRVVLQARDASIRSPAVNVSRTPKHQTRGKREFSPARRQSIAGRNDEKRRTQKAIGSYIGRGADR
jgi:hypothetical protein